MHQDQVTRLPENSVLLGRSEHCPIAAFRVGETMFGVQAHPEFTHEYSATLLTDRIERIGAERVQAARESLLHATDEGVFTQWVAAFLAASMFAITGDVNAQQGRNNGGNQGGGNQGGQGGGNQGGWGSAPSYDEPPF